MEFSTHGNGNNLDDLYILPDNARERRFISDYLHGLNLRWSLRYSDVPGQYWFGKRFFDIPFGEHLIDGISKEVRRRYEL